MEEIDPANIPKLDERIHFQIDGKHYAYNQETYSAGMSIQEAKSLVKLEEKFLILEIKDRKLKGIDLNVDMTDIEKEHLEKIKDEIIQIIRHEKRKERYKTQGKEYDDFGVLVNELKKEASKKYEGYKGKSLEGKIAAINKAKGNQEVFGLVSAVAEVEDASQAQFDKIKKSLADIQVNVPEFKLEEIKKKAVELIIQKEVANRPETETLTFDTVQDLLQRSELSEETMRQYLSDEDLKNYLHDVYVGKKELFSATATVEQKAEREELLRVYKDKTRSGVVKKMNKIDDADWEPEILYGDIHKFLLNDKPSFRELSPFLSREQFMAMYKAIYLTDGNTALFDTEGRPLGEEGSQIIDNFLREAKAAAKGNEYLAIEDYVLDDWSNKTLGKSVDKALEAYEKTISENKPSSWRERNTFFVLNAKVRERRQKKLDNYMKAKNEKKRVERFKESYLREQGAHVAKLWEFERSVKEKIGDPENLLSENLDQRTRGQIRKIASSLRLEGLYLNEKIIKRLDGLIGCSELKSAFAGEGYETFDDFVAAEVIDQSGWKLPSKLGEQNEKYGTSLHNEKQNFVSEMNYESIRHVIKDYMRNEVMEELRRGVKAQLRREFLKNGHIIDNEAIKQRMTNKYPEAELNRIVEKRINDKFTELRDKFNNENAGGLLDFAANVGYIGKMIRRDLYDEIFGERGKKNINVTKVIDLLDSQRINDLHLSERDRRFKLEMKRFTSKERWRQRWETVDRVISGNPLFKKNEYRGLVNALEEGTSYRSVAYQVSVKAKTHIYNAFDYLFEFGNMAKRNIVYTPFSWIAPYSEVTRQKIADTLENQQKRCANRNYRRERIFNFGVPII